MNSFKTLTGKLLVGECASEDEQVESPKQEDLYSQAVFVSDEVSLQFYSGIGGYFLVEEEHFMTENNNTFYYPYFNETNVSIEMPVNNRENLTVHKEDVKLEYQVVNNNTYIRSGSEITAYTGFYFTTNGNIYQCHGSLLVHPEEESQADEFLGLESVQNPVTVENIETGHAVSLNYSTIEEIIESDSNNNGFLKVGSPKNLESRLSQELNALE